MIGRGSVFVVDRDMTELVVHLVIRFSSFLLDERLLML